MTFWPKEPVEKYIDVGTAFRGQLGWGWKKTIENAQQIAYDLLSKDKYSGETIIAQLNNAIHRIKNYQILSFTAFAVSITTLFSLICDPYRHFDAEQIRALKALTLPPFLALYNIIRLDSRRLLYREIRNEAKQLTSIDDVVEIP